MVGSGGTRAFDLTKGHWSGRGSCRVWRFESGKKRCNWTGRFHSFVLQTILLFPISFVMSDTPADGGRKFEFLSHHWRDRCAVEVGAGAAVAASAALALGV